MELEALFCPLHESVLEYSGAWFLLSWNVRRASLDRTAISSARFNIARFFAASVNNDYIGELSHIVVSVFPGSGAGYQLAIGVLAGDTLREEFVFEVDSLDFSMPLASSVLNGSCLDCTILDGPLVCLSFSRRIMIAEKGMNRLCSILSQC